MDYRRVHFACFLKRQLKDLCTFHYRLKEMDYFSKNLLLCSTEERKLYTYIWDSMRVCK